MNKKLILFDIDGTLILGDHPAARQSIVYALEKVFNLTNVEFNWQGLHGSTDKGMFKILAANYVNDLSDYETKIEHLSQARFEYFNENVTEDYQERILAGAKEILETLQKDKRIILGVLTGNFEKIGWHKLKLVGLNKYFKFGIFGDIAQNRNELAKNVFRLSKKNLNLNLKPDQIIIIGDTPRDVECAKYIGAKVIAVTTGVYKKKDLGKADLIVSSLEDKKIIQKINSW